MQTVRRFCWRSHWTVLAGDETTSRRLPSSDLLLHGPVRRWSGCGHLRASNRAQQRSSFRTQAWVCPLLLPLGTRCRPSPRWWRSLQALRVSRRASGSADPPSPSASGSGYLADILRPVLFVSLLSFVLYPIVVEAIAGLLDPVALGVIKGDVSQYMQNFFNYNGLLFSFFASQTYSFLYNQQESIYLALYAEVTEARSLMEQLTLISQGRPTYPAILRSMRDYVEELAYGVRSNCPPALLVAAKPLNDPLENILYLTSVGVPSAAYETVRSLRQARGVRLGATQRKLPPEHFSLLRVLAALELLAFPLLGAGVSTYEPLSQENFPGHIISVQALVFALLAGGVFLTLQVIQDLQAPTSGLYSLEASLGEMVEGLQQELERRTAQAPTARGETQPQSWSWAEEASALQQLESEAHSRDGVQKEHEVHEEGEGLRPRAGAAVFPRAEEEVEGRLSSLQPSSEEFSFSRRIVFCIAGGLVAALVFPVLVRVLRSSFSVPALLAIREDNNAQWMQNFFTGIGFIFSLFVAQTFGFLYGQQEQIYFALYAEVSEAKALLEQLTLVCRTRNSYGQMLLNLQKYVRGDLQRLDCSPTQLLAGRASGTSGRDPLESVLYATSVGVPSYVYETVRGLRQARGARLGATQKKLPDAHFAILNILGILELSVFPILAAGCAALEPPGMASRPGHIVFFHAILFGVMTSGVALTLSVLWDLFSPVGETYNLQTIVRDMASGLDEELEARIQTAGEREPQEQEISSTPAQSQSSPA